LPILSSGVAVQLAFSRHLNMSSLVASWTAIVSNYLFGFGLLD
jgi:hypothetical protein